MFSVGMTAKMFPLSRTKASRLVAEVIALSDAFKSKSNPELWDISNSLRGLVDSGQPIEDHLPIAFAVVREASRRVHNQAHYEVQVLAGIGLLNGTIVEMQTGEGKTLAALLPAFTRALTGKGCHVVTANDYLARRDAQFARAVFERLGMTVGCLDENLPRMQRPDEYAKDVTFGTAREFGFDFLKDRLSSVSGGIHVQRSHHFALVDEADSVMIDDARTPLLIAGESEPDPVRVNLISRCHQVALSLAQSEDFQLDTRQRTTTLTKLGCLKVLKHLDGFLFQRIGKEDIFEQVENSLTANHLFHRGHQYIVDDSKVVIVDESTGRIADGRKWQNGLHQAIEAKESVAISAGTETLARITVQSYFRRYQYLAGLTGTAKQAANEFKKVYSLGVTQVPTRLPSKRLALPERIFATYDQKANSVAIETKERQLKGEAILIGTPSVEASRKISAALSSVGVEHVVLNCERHEDESRIIENAGQPGRVTVATNMDVIGTDIHVGYEVFQNGGLHVIVTERHSSSRIDRQLVGRCARQGQAGSFQFFLSLEDELLSMVSRPKSTFGNAENSSSELGKKWIKRFDSAQLSIEKQHEQQRLELYDQEVKRNKRCLEMGLEPVLDLLEE